jgi:hypothetical protein
MKEAARPKGDFSETFFVDRICNGRNLGRAYAVSIDPRCARMRDPLGCTCAVRNGGGIKTDRGTGGTRWYSKRGAANTAPNEKFVRCQMQAGRK